MALDNAQFIAELSITDPPGSDPLSQGDDQIRTIKRATQQSFPNIDKAVTLTADQMNLAAIKNEENEFTAKQIILQQTIQLDDVLDNDVLSYLYFTAGVPDWGLANDNNTVLSESKFRMRRWIAGVAQADAYQIDQVTGVMDFDQVPTVQGAPLWIAGEIRMFVAAATPGTNWFIADGTNGTVDLDDRVLVGEGISSPGTLLAPNLVGTAAAGTTGSTAISSAQMPSHRHRIRSGGASGITDVALGNVSTQTVVGGNRGNTSSAFFDTNSGGQQFIENTGSGSGHTHTKAAAAVTENGADRNTVRPLSAVVQYHQYVP
jgi:hypothetical protein